VCVASFANATTATGGERIAVFRGIDSRALGFGYITKPPVRGFFAVCISSTNLETRLSAGTLPFYLSWLHACHLPGLLPRSERVCHFGRRSEEGAVAGEE